MSIPASHGQLRAPLSIAVRIAEHEPRRIRYAPPAPRRASNTATSQIVTAAEVHATKGRQDPVEQILATAWSVVHQEVPRSASPFAQSRLTS